MTRKHFIAIAEAIRNSIHQQSRTGGPGKGTGTSPTGSKPELR